MPKYKRCVQMGLKTCWTLAGTRVVYKHTIHSCLNIQRDFCVPVGKCVWGGSCRCAEKGDRIECIDVSFLFSLLPKAAACPTAPGLDSRLSLFSMQDLPDFPYQRSPVLNF